MIGLKNSYTLLIGVCISACVLCQDGGNSTKTSTANPSTTPSKSTPTPTPTPTPTEASTSPTPTPDPTTSSSAGPPSTVSQGTTTTQPFNGYYELKSNGTVCIRAAMTAVFIIPFTSKGQTTTQNATVTLPTSSRVTGSCSDDRATMTLSWERGYQFDLVFETKTADSEKVWEVTSLAFTYDVSVLTNSSSSTPTTVKIQNTSISSTLGQPYSCKSNQQLVFKSERPVELQLSDLMVQAFDVPKEKFGPDGTACIADITENKKVTENNVIPVAVAGTLAALILIIIVAYFIMKARNNNQYKPME